MLANVVVFALIGLCVGGAARMFYPGRQPMRILGTLVLGMAGALLGGLFSWAVWPVMDAHVHSGALLMSFLGAALGLVLWAGVVYARSIGGHVWHA